MNEMDVNDFDIEGIMVMVGPCSPYISNARNHRFHGLHR